MVYYNVEESVNIKGRNNTSIVSRKSTVIDHGSNNWISSFTEEGSDNSNQIKLSDWML